KYIAYEEKQVAAEVRRSKSEEEAGPSRRGPDKRKERQSPKHSKPPPSKFTGYTPLNAPRERILDELSSADFKKAGI
ncbi:hypothetical protein A2U01_0084445, partial [Trifolium medium]|nr:hypothetical protein [Trifolium medium]